LSSARSRNDPELRFAAQEEPIPIAEPPRALNGNGANRSQSTHSRALSPREAEIARFAAAGLSNKQIARSANISNGTVKVHLYNAYKKLGIANRTTFAGMVSSDASAWGQGQR
jgi:DNA-binding NarL/FixJ family response regulator